MATTSAVLLLCLAFSVASCSVVRRQTDAAESVDLSILPSTSTAELGSSQIGVSESEQLPYLSQFSEDGQGSSISIPSVNLADFTSSDTGANGQESTNPGFSAGGFSTDSGSSSGGPELQRLISLFSGNSRTDAASQGSTGQTSSLDWGESIPSGTSGVRVSNIPGFTGEFSSPSSSGTQKPVRGPEGAGSSRITSTSDEGSTVPVSFQNWRETSQLGAFDSADFQLPGSSGTQRADFQTPTGQSSSLFNSRPSERQQASAVPTGGLNGGPNMASTFGTQVSDLQVSPGNFMIPPSPGNFQRGFQNFAEGSAFTPTWTNPAAPGSDRGYAVTRLPANYQLRPLPPGSGNILGYPQTNYYPYISPSSGNRFVQGSTPIAFNLQPGSFPAYRVPVGRFSAPMGRPM